MTGPAKTSLNINVTKTKAVVFRSPGLNLKLETQLHYDNFVIEYVHQIKELGIIFSSNLSWNQHVEFTRSKLCKITGIINKHRHFLSADVKLALYKSL